jgi:hypothetical protein
VKKGFCLEVSTSLAKKGSNGGMSNSGTPVIQKYILLLNYWVEQRKYFKTVTTKQQVIDSLIAEN